MMKEGNDAHLLFFLICRGKHPPLFRLHLEISYIFEEWVFYIFDTKNSVIRGEHSHYNTKQFLIAVSGSCTIESVPLGTKNYYTIVNSSATGNLTWQHGQSAGNKITFTAPYVDLQDITQDDNEGYQMLNIAYRALPSSGNDEMSLKFH